MTPPLMLFELPAVSTVVETMQRELPGGLDYLPDFIRPSEETALLKAIDTLPWITDLKRRVQHYGYRYDYKARRINSSMQVNPLPDWGQALALRLFHEGITPFIPDQLIINEYEPGQGITAHVDCEPCFEDVIVSVSLGSGCVMDFTHVSSAAHVPLYLSPRSVVAMSGESRYDWKHGIAARRNDKVAGRTLPRERRISLTFRKVILQD
ncbi:MAG: alpha-ketoglutarate-dependent dioxygenase AlkB [Bacteroidia bacterium]|jgi:alkylated DNA repair dioxygenase AlkB|nr:alpha-ketoglutarate-dependent dioxygenase AlkB [Bacteroidia bacterium]